MDVKECEKKDCFNIEGITYVLKEKDRDIAYGVINNLNKRGLNKIEIYVLPEYRGNGYGTKMFKSLLPKVNLSEPLYFSVYKGNICAVKMLMNVHATLTSEDNDEMRFVL